MGNSPPPSLPTEIAGLNEPLEPWPLRSPQLALILGCLWRPTHEPAPDRSLELHGARKRRLRLYFRSRGSGRLGLEKALVLKGYIKGL